MNANEFHRKYLRDLHFKRVFFGLEKETAAKNTDPGFLGSLMCQNTFSR